MASNYHNNYKMTDYAINSNHTYSGELTIDTNGFLGQQETTLFSKENNPNIWNIQLGDLVYIRTRLGSDNPMLFSIETFGGLFHQEHQRVHRPSYQSPGDLSYRDGKYPDCISPGISNLGHGSYTPGGVGPGAPWTDTTIHGLDVQTLGGTYSMATGSSKTHISTNNSTYSHSTTTINVPKVKTPRALATPGEQQQQDPVVPESKVLAFKTPTDIRTNVAEVLTGPDRLSMEEYQKAIDKSRTEDTYELPEGVPMTGIVIDKLVPKPLVSETGEVLEQPTLPTMYKLLITGEHPQETRELWFIEHVVKPTDPDNTELKQA